MNKPDTQLKLTLLESPKHKDHQNKYRYGNLGTNIYSKGRETIRDNDNNLTKSRINQ